MNKPLLRPTKSNSITSAPPKYVEKIDNYDEEELVHEQINRFWLYLEVPIYCIMAVFFTLAWFLDDGTLKKRHVIIYVMLFYLLQAFFVMALSYGLVSIGFCILCTLRERVIAYKLWESKDQISAFFHILTIGGTTICALKLLFFSPDISNIYAVVYLVVVMLFSFLIFLKHIVMFFFLKESLLPKQFVIVDGRVCKIKNDNLAEARMQVEESMGLLDLAKFVGENDSDFFEEEGQINISEVLR